MNYLYEYGRMCNEYTERGSCAGCPLMSYIETVRPQFDSCTDMIYRGFNSVRRIIDDWRESSGRKTYEDDLLEKYPEYKGFDADTGEPTDCRRHFYPNTTPPTCDCDCMYCWYEYMPKKAKRKDD